MNTVAQEKYTPLEAFSEGANADPVLCYHPGWTIDEGVCPHCGATGWGGYLNEKVLERLSHTAVKAPAPQENVKLYDSTAPLTYFI